MPLTASDDDNNSMVDHEGDLASDHAGRAAAAGAHASGAAAAATATSSSRFAGGAAAAAQNRFGGLPSSLPAPPALPIFAAGAWAAADARPTPGARARISQTGLPPLLPPPSGVAELADVTAPAYLERTSPFRELLLYPTHGGENRGPLERSIIRWVADAWNAQAVPIQYGKLVGALRLGLPHIFVSQDAKAYLEEHLRPLVNALNNTEGPQASAHLRFVEGPLRAIFVGHCLGVPMGSEAATRPLAACERRLQQLAVTVTGGGVAFPAPLPRDMDSLYEDLQGFSARNPWAPWTAPPKAVAAHRARRVRAKAVAARQ
jgi:hypothetical protein